MTTTKRQPIVPTTVPKHIHVLKSGHPCAAAYQFHFYDGHVWVRNRIAILDVSIPQHKTWSLRMQKEGFRHINNTDEGVQAWRRWSD